MKNIIKYILILTLVSLSFATTPTNVNVDVTKISKVYDYSDFSVAGGVSCVYDASVDKYTYVYKNATVTGFQGSDGFVVEEIVEKYASGMTKKVSDLVNQRYTEYSDEGVITGAYSLYENKKYDGVIEYYSDGSYMIKWSGKIDKDGDPNTTDDQEVLSDATIQKFDPVGKLIEVESKSWDKEKKCWEKSVSEYIYDGAGNKLKMETYSSNNKLLSETYFDSLGREAYTIGYKYGKENGVEKLQYTYLASKEFYDGFRHIKAENYEPTGPGTQKLNNTIFYDNHGRVSYVTDALGKVISRTYYNDSTKTLTYCVPGTNITVTVRPGQIVKLENYTSHENGTKTKVVTYYNENRPRVESQPEVIVTNQDRFNAWLKQHAPDIPIAVDPTATGRLVVKEIAKGETYVIFEITDLDKAREIAEELKKARDRQGSGLDQFFDQLLVLLGDTNKDGKISDAEWKAKGSKVELYVGAIDPEAAKKFGDSLATGTSGNYGQTGEGMNRKEIDTQQVWNDNLMKQIIEAAQQGRTVTLNWTYWAVDGKNNIWIFAEGMK